MKNTVLTLFTFLIISAAIHGQEPISFYATMNAQDAIDLKQELPNELSILATRHDQSAVYISEYAVSTLQESHLLFGPGYVFKESKAKAIQSLEHDLFSQNNKTILYTITEDALVNDALDRVDENAIETEILALENYGTRYHTKSTATQAIIDLKDKWEAMALAAGRTDVNVRIYNHTSTNMPSVILTIEGAETPDDYIIVGGHMDSTNPSNNNDAPGADDNGSGIATLIEMTRVLFEMNFVPKKTIEIMAFAAEEIGLVGSSEIAQEYSDATINVEAFVQFDMTNYKGSSNDVYISTDYYTSTTLNNFLFDLMDHYNLTGVHEFTYSTSACNYGCSDHFSWAQVGYDAAFPFEASFGQHNPYIHTSNDTYSVSGNSEHAAKFAKLGIEFLIESTKSFVLSVDDYLLDDFIMFVKDKRLIYQLEATTDMVLNVSIYDTTGKKIAMDSNSQRSGIISLENVTQGFYIAVFKLENQGYITKRFILQ